MILGYPTRQLSEREKKVVISLRAAIKPEILEAWNSLEADKCEQCKGQKGNYKLPKDLKFLEENSFSHYPCHCDKIANAKPVEEKPKQKTITIKNKELPSLF